MDEALHTSETYERHADAYEEKYLGGSVAADHGDSFLDALDGDRVLDVGCGPGSDTATFADSGLDVTGVDVTQSFLVAAADHLDTVASGDSQDGSASFARGDMRHLPFDADTFDGVWSCAAVHHVPKDEAVTALAEFARVLRDDGVVFCSVKRGAHAGFEPATTTATATTGSSRTTRTRSSSVCSATRGSTAACAWTTAGCLRSHGLFESGLCESLPGCFVNTQNAPTSVI
jgi:SAM-dependent methyltransferase